MGPQLVGCVNGPVETEGTGAGDYQLEPQEQWLPPKKAQQLELPLESNVYTLHL